MKKIYITSLHTRHGGCEFVVTSLANAFVKRGHDVEVLISYNFGSIAYPFDERVKLTYLTDVLPNKDELKAAIKSLNPIRIFKEAIYSVKVLKLKKSTMKEALSSLSDCAVIATRTEHAVLLSKYGQKNVLKIAQLHADYAIDKKAVKAFKTGYGNIDFFALLTPKMVRELTEVFKSNSHTKLLHIPNFIIPEDINPAPTKEKQFIAAGRLHSDKNFQSLLRVWKTVSDKHPEYVLKICGDGEQKEELTEYAKELGIADKVILTGAVSHFDLVSEMAKSKGYIMTSRTEMFPLVLLEAFYAGCPVCTYDYRVGADAIVDNGKNGFIVDNGDESALADKICYLIESPETQAEMAISAKEKSNDFSEDSIMNKWTKIIGE